MDCKVLLLVCVALCCLHVSCTHKIIMAVGFNPSHLIYFGELAKHLIDKGHEVTIVHPDRLHVPKSLATSGIDFRSFKAEIPISIPEVEKMIMDLAFDYSAWKNLKLLATVNDAVNAEVFSLYTDVTLMADLDAAGYDFAVIDIAVAHTILPYRLGIPFATLGVDCANWNIRSPDLPSYVPSLLSSYSDHMTFKQRFINILYHVAYAYYYHGGHAEVAKHAPGLPVVGYADIIGNASLCLKLRESLVDYAKGTPPNVISIGSMMARPGTPLPDHYQTFMDNAPHGVIYMSFGSHPFPYPTAVTRKLIDALARVKQKVIWKEPHIDKGEVSDNVIVVDWAPQVSILAHPACRLFITHGGVNSLLEAAYHGVPLIAFPFALDQNFNAAMIASKHYGLQMAVNSFTTDELVRGIDDVLTGSYQAEMSTVSAAFRDLPPGGGRAVYWIEHVIKHGSEHMRLRAVHMPWYQYLMVDVMTLILVVCVMSMYVWWKLCSCVCKRCCKTSRKDKTE